MGASPTTCAVDLDFNTFQIRNFSEINAGRQLMDIEVRRTSEGLRLSGIWFSLGRDVEWVFDVNEVGWLGFQNSVATVPGRWLDMEVVEVGGERRFFGIYLPGGEPYESFIRYTMDDAELQAVMESRFEAGMQIIDIEAYEYGGETRFAGIWQGGARQPRTVLYYPLHRDELQDLLVPQYPLDPESGLAPLKGLVGVPIDLEAFESPDHGETRFALIMALHTAPSGIVWYGQSAEEMLGRIDDHSTATRHMVDLEVDPGLLDGPYSAIWGAEHGPLYELDALVDDGRELEMTSAIRGLIEDFEDFDIFNETTLGTIGIYARNVRTGQYVEYQSDRPFYLASVSKIAIHSYLWQQYAEPGSGVDPNQTLTFTRNPWWIESRDDPGLDTSDLGKDLSLERLDLAMMKQSDNAATSMLVEAILGRSGLNRWLAGAGDWASGFGPITGITDLDRTILWQSGVGLGEDQPTPSYFLQPSWEWEPMFRDTGLSDLDLDDQAQGHERYFRMGLNTAEPRAVGLLMEQMVTGALPGFVEPKGTGTVAAKGIFKNNLALGSILLNGEGALLPIPNSPDGSRDFADYGKNGAKASSSKPEFDGLRVTNETAIFERGPETIIIGVFTRDNVRQNQTVEDSYLPELGYWLFRQLIPDLTDAGTRYHSISDTSIPRHRPWSVRHRVLNGTLDVAGAEARPYEIRYFASTNTNITESDFELGSFHTPTVHPGGELGSVVQHFPKVPKEVPDGQYYIGWWIDPGNDVGEWDDRSGSNVGILSRADGSPQLVTIFHDCNLNNLPDADDIASGLSEDINANGYPDECEMGSVPWDFEGTAAGGQVEIVVDGYSTTCSVTVTTTAGETAAMVAANLAAAINGDACFTSQMITAVADGGRLTIEGFAINALDVSENITDPGLGHSMPIPEVPTLSPGGLLVLAGLLIWLARRRLTGG